MLTPASRAQDFPVLETCAYLNSAAESIPPKSVSVALARYAEDKGKGMRGRDDHFAELERCRETAAKLLARRRDLYREDAACGAVIVTDYRTRGATSRRVPR